jgi:hypothetical protein
MTDSACWQFADRAMKAGEIIETREWPHPSTPANSLIFGRAGDAYHAAVTAGTIAQHSNVISEEMNNLHRKYPTDPPAFKAAADAGALHS